MFELLLSQCTQSNLKVKGYWLKDFSVKIYFVSQDVFMGLLIVLSMFHTHRCKKSKYYLYQIVLLTNNQKYVQL